MITAATRVALPLTLCLTDTDSMSTDYASWKPIALKRDSACAHCGIQMSMENQSLRYKAKSQVALLVNSCDQVVEVSQDRAILSRS